MSTYLLRKKRKDNLIKRHDNCLDMKILMVISQFHPIIGGAERQAQLLAQKLIEKGIQVHVVTGWWKRGTPRREIINGIQIFRNFSFWGMFGIKGLRPLAALTYMGTLGVYLLAHKREYDLIHVHQALHPAFVSVFAGKRFLGKPVIVKTASSGMTSDIRQLKQVPLGSFQLRYLLRHMECLVAVSKAGGKEFNDIGFPESQIVHIPNGVVLPHDGKANYGQVKRVITTARLSKEKGIDILLRAWAHVVRHEKGLKLILVGDGPLAVALKELCQSLGLTESVEFTGIVRNPMEYLKGADLFVLPSRSEGLSNALLEAMSYGLPCIATNVGGNVELAGEDRHKKIMPGEFIIARNGLLVNPDDVEGTSKAMLYLIRSRAEREEMGNKGRLCIEKNFSIDLIADKYIELYHRMIDRKS
jgi:glycosyltransferase involved in cell wall biosynthesis